MKSPTGVIFTRRRACSIISMRSARVLADAVDEEGLLQDITDPVARIQ